MRLFPRAAQEYQVAGSRQSLCDEGGGPLHEGAETG